MAARHDLNTDPDVQAALLTVRRGTAFWSRKVNELMDADLDGDSRLSGWTRRHVIAHVGLNARALTRLVQWANTGVETPMYDSPEQRNHEIDYSATLPPRALRHLNDHAAISLNVEWRDTPDAAWGNIVRTAQGREVPLTETVWMRNREVWIHAFDLGNGARFSDIPRDVLARLAREVPAMWARRGEGVDLRITATDAPELGELGGGAGSASARVVSGPLAGVVRWMTGRGSRELTEGADVPNPRWL